ncbi:hypothetical protein GN956_G4596 [Arapaima gigas]
MRRSSAGARHKHAAVRGRGRHRYRHRYRRGGASIRHETVASSCGRTRVGGWLECAGNTLLREPAPPCNSRRGRDTSIFISVNMYVHLYVNKPA